MISNEAFRALLDLFMEADPWPFTAAEKPIEALLEDEARERG